MFDALIKVGGSVCNSPSLKGYASVWSKLARSYRLLFLTGGGLFADQVRVIDNYFDLSDSAAHWMAIASMDQCGYLLADCLPGVRTVHDVATALAIAAKGCSSVFIPSSFLKEEDPLPHTWQVTSDSLAAWLAGHIGINRLVVMKDVAGVYQHNQRHGASMPLAEVAREELGRYQVVDPCFATLLPPEIDCWIIDGRQPQRLAELLASGTTTGTRVMPARATEPAIESHERGDDAG